MKSRTLEFTVPKELVKDLLINHYTSIGVLYEDENVEIDIKNDIPIECRVVEIPEEVEVRIFNDGKT